MTKNIGTKMIIGVLAVIIVILAVIIVVVIVYSNTGNEYALALSYHSSLVSTQQTLASANQTISNDNAQINNLNGQINSLQSENIQLQNELNTLLPSCEASVGYLCTNLFYKAGRGTLTFTFGQNTGNNWVNAKIYFVPAGSTYTSSDPNFVLTGILASGATTPVSIIIPRSLVSNTSETPLTGSIFANYTLPSETTNYVADVAIVATKAQ